MTLATLFEWIVTAALAFPAAGTPDSNPSLKAGTEGTLAMRVAFAGLAEWATHGTEVSPTTPANTLSQALADDPRVVIIDPSLARPAIAAIGYQGEINMTTVEARRLAAAIGCDFLVTGKAEVLSRSEREGQTHQEAMIAVMFVDGRSGELVVFDLVTARDSSVAGAIDASTRELNLRASEYIDRIATHHSRRLEPGSRPSDHTERIENMPDEGSASAGFSPPEFLNRVKPDYTAQAELAAITATVEALVVFGSNGEVGEIEIVRWAGFGLDESAARAIRQLKFKPATRDGKPISVRALVQYNFRRLDDPGVPQDVQPRPPEKAAPDLRHLFKRRFPPASEKPPEPLR